MNSEHYYIFNEFYENDNQGKIGITSVLILKISIVKMRLMLVGTYIRLKKIRTQT